MSSRYRVLVIDDDQMFRSLVQTILRKDFFVSVAAHGQEGFLKAKEHRPDVAIIDVQMPGWSGIDTLRAFHMDAQLSDIKTIMLTADASKETVLAAVHSGADDYVIKSCFNKKEFVYKIYRQILGPEAATQMSLGAGFASLPSIAPPMPVSGHSCIEGDGLNAHFSPRRETVTASKQSNDKIQEIVDSWE